MFFFPLDACFTAAMTRPRVSKERFIFNLSLSRALPVFQIMLTERNALLRNETDSKRSKKKKEQNKLTGDLLEPRLAFFVFSDPAKSTKWSLPRLLTVSLLFFTSAKTLIVKIQCERLECLFILVSPILLDCWA